MYMHNYDLFSSLVNNDLFRFVLFCFHPLHFILTSYTHTHTSLSILFSWPNCCVVRHCCCCVYLLLSRVELFFVVALIFSFVYLAWHFSGHSHSGKWRFVKNINGSLKISRCIYTWRITNYSHIRWNIRDEAEWGERMRRGGGRKCANQRKAEIEELFWRRWYRPHDIQINPQRTTPKWIYATK